MTEEQFRSEILDYVGAEYDRYLEIRKLIGEMAQIFHQLCCQNDISYCLAYGSLLGEIRDGGMIPWDPDMDVFVPMDQLERLIHVLETQLPEGYFLESDVVDHGYPYFESRIGKMGYPTEKVHFDIFYLIAVPDCMDAQECSNQIRKLVQQRFDWFQSFEKYSKEAGCGRLHYYARKIHLKLRSHFRTGRSLDQEFHKLCQAGDYRSARWLCSVCDTAEIYPRELMEPMEIRNLNGRDVGLPRDPVGVLNAIYADYQKYYPIANRYQEFYDWMRAYRKLTGEQKEIHYYR